MKIKLLITTLAIFGIVNAARLYGQITFYKQYGQGQVQSGIGSSCVQQTFDGGYVMAGFIYPSSSDAQVYLVKTNANGDTLWTKIIGGTFGFYMGTFVQQTLDTGFVITGTYQAGAVYIIKTNSVGDTLWTKHYNNQSSVITSVQQTTDNGYIVVSTSQTMSGNVWLLKTDVNGDTLWTKEYGGNSSFGYSVQQTSDGGYIIAGETWNNTAGSSDAYLLKTNSSGDTLWTKKYGGSDGESAKEVKQTTDGGYIICGSSSGQIYVVKTDSNGNAIWQKYFGGLSSDEGTSVKQTADGGYIIAGKIEHFSTILSAYVSDACLLKINASGIQQWNKDFGPLLGNPSPSYGNYVSLTSDGGYILTGVNQLDYLIKTDSFGNILTTGIFSENVAEDNFLTFIYPNPFSSQTTLQSTEIFKNATLIVYNAFGQHVKQMKNISGQTITVYRDNLPNGVYFIHLTQDNKEIITKKIIIAD